MSKKIMMFDRWGELHSDLLHEIVKHLHSSKDYVKLRILCKSWNASLPKTPNHIRGPQLMLPFNDDTFDIEEKDFYLRLPEMRNTLLRGSGFGWLISIDIEGVLRMLNPFTKAQLDLPPMLTIPDIVDYRPNMKDYEYIIRDFANNGDDDEANYTIDKSHVQQMHLKKIIISSSPDNRDFMAITIYSEDNRLAFCRFADNKWTDFSTPEIVDCGLEDAIFYEEKIYAIDWRAQLFEFDVKTSIGSISDVAKPDDLDIPFADMNTKYLIRSVEDNLLMVVRHFKDHLVGRGEDEVSCYNTFKFDIYKLDTTSAKQWKRMFSLENYVLVVGYNSSVCMLPFSDSKGNWVKNCIYFTDNNYGSQCGKIIGGHDVDVFNLENGRVDKLFPNSEFIYPPPIWLFS